MSFADFFLCHAPHGKYPAQVVTQIYHDGSPRFFGSIISVGLAEEEIVPVNYGGVNIPFILHLPQGESRLYIIVLDKRSSRPSARLSEALERAALWYSTYLHQVNNAKSRLIDWGLFQPVSDLTPELRILELKRQKTWILSFPEGVMTFTDPEKMDEFISSVLGYSEAQLAEGTVNAISGFLSADDLS